MSYEKLNDFILQRVKHITAADFDRLALDVFQLQATRNDVYARFLSLLNIDPARIRDIDSIPFLPIQFFKNYTVKTGAWEPQAVFSSSGTTAETTSSHEVRDLAFYLDNTVKGFEKFYGSPEGYCFLALLPSYLERTNSSLVAMADHFIHLSKFPESGFFLYNTSDLRKVLSALKEKRIPTVLLGVSFALLDLAAEGDWDLKGVIVMETGGMKGRRTELTRPELHQMLTHAFRVPCIHSEYGMTELLSQAYALQEGRFRPAPTLKITTREITDPLAAQAPGRTGVINAIDLANFHSCSFIATDDLGRVFPDGSFEVLGRLDDSDIRGCNLLLNP